MLSRKIAYDIRAEEERKRDYMKNKVIIVIMVVILFSLLGKLFLNGENQNGRVKPEEISYNTMEELAEFILLENEIAVNSMGVVTERVPVEDIYAAIYVADGQAPVADTDINRQPEYVTLYPSLYTTPLEDQESPDNGKKIAYLTFDDGPSENTWKVLDILDEKNVKATFFIIGGEISIAGENTLKEIVERGHTIGLHTYCHNYKTIYSSVEAFLADYEKVYQEIYQITGQKPNIYRFPGGSYNSYMKSIRKEIIEEMSRRGFTFYDWNVSAEDAVGTPTAYSIKKNVKKDAYRFQCPVILMHDGQSNALTTKVLGDIIDEIRDNGYDFDTLDHRDPCQFNWKK